MTSRGCHRKMAPRIPVVQNMTVRHPATIISAAPEMILLLITKENLLSTAMPQLPIPMTIHPRIWKGGRSGSLKLSK